MKNFCKAIIFLIILAVINSQTNCGDQSSITKKDCLARTTKEEREIGTYCCYIEMKLNQDTPYSKKCLRIKEEEMEMAKAEIEEIKITTGYAKLDCEPTSESDSNSDSNSDSYYIQIKILLFILVLL